MLVFEARGKQEYPEKNLSEQGRKRYGMKYVQYNWTSQVAYQVSVEWNDSEHYYSPVDGILVHRRVTPSSAMSLFGSLMVYWHSIIHLGTDRQCQVKFLVLGNNTIPCRDHASNHRQSDFLTVTGNPIEIQWPQWLRCFHITIIE